jgi:LmbE family N-acetylglucosaminyl deacetylase
MAQDTNGNDVEPEGPLRWLMVAAHPDDLDFGCAGTTAGLTTAGHEVVYCVVTDGQAGGFDGTITRKDMAEIRRQEQTSAAKVVGVTELHFLGFPDGAVEPTLELRRALTRVIRLVRPDRVVTQSYVRNLDRIYGSHPDHLAVGESTLNAVYPDARNEFAFPELMDQGLEPHTVPEVWIVGGPDPDHWVDITDTFDLKIEALLCHESQIPEPERLPTMMRQWATTQAERAGLGEGRLAEGFRRVSTA